MSVESGLVFVCLFLIALCAIAHYFRNSPLPVVCWVVLFGVAYGMLQKFTLTELGEERAWRDGFFELSPRRTAHHLLALSHLIPNVAAIHVQVHQVIE